MHKTQARHALEKHSSREKKEKTAGPPRLVDLFFRPLADEIDRVRVELLDAVQEIREMVEAEIVRRESRKK